MQITVHLKPGAAKELRKKGSEKESSKELLQVAKELGVRLKPMHPDEKDPALASYFTAEVADPKEAARVAARLRECDATEAAYVKPSEEMP